MTQSQTAAAAARTSAASPETEVLLQCTGLTKTLRSGERDITVLDHVDLEVRRAEFLAIVGPSGSGKSTLLGLLAGLDRATSGSVKIRGRALEAMDEDELALMRRGQVGFVFQSFQLLGNLTARENVVLPMELGGMPDADDRAAELLEQVGLGDRGHHYPSQLSGGEQQRVAVARAFGPRPALLFADEPTGNLDSESGARVLDMLLGLRDELGTALVLVTHDLEIAETAPRAIYLRSGKIEREENR
ncbi:putative ABC transporter ATP-binding protein [Planctomycetes bacterium Poly30]|uniref:Putative ABC transporter ATP-binding protein n=1 Tax=Saltatorellus ferox TaxID=2528018 RepID=A0A518EZE1_9BACT|nr:putative ABC transporter ATP-binding protein [Planctomycetes bacterium Poly30]